MKKCRKKTWDDELSASIDDATATGHDEVLAQLLDDAFFDVDVDVVLDAVRVHHPSVLDQNPVLCALQHPQINIFLRIEIFFFKFFHQFDFN